MWSTFRERFEQTTLYSRMSEKEGAEEEILLSERLKIAHTRISKN